MGNTSLIWHTRVQHCLALEKEGVRLGVVVMSDDRSAHDWTIIVKHGIDEPKPLLTTILPEALQVAEQYALEWLGHAE